MRGRACSRRILSPATSVGRKRCRSTKSWLVQPTWRKRRSSGRWNACRRWARVDQAAAELERFSAAHPANTDVRLRLASLWIEQGKVSQTQELIKGLAVQNGTDVQWKKYLEGRLLLAQDQAAPALANFEELQRNPNELTEGLLFGATLGSAEARAVLSGFDSGGDVLEKFISHYGESAYLEEAFRRLDEMYEQVDHPSDSELKKWMQKTPPRRAALAEYYYARLTYRAHKIEKAASILDHFVQMYPTSPLLNSVYLLQADLHLEKGNLPAAVRALDEAMRGAKNDEERAQIELRTALVYYRQGESLLAENSFRRAAQGSEAAPAKCEVRCALAALNRHNYDSFFEDYRDLGKRRSEQSSARVN